MKLPTLTLFICILFMACNNKEMTPVDLAEEMIQTFESKSSLSYDIHYRIKFFSSIEDTVKTYSHVDLIQVPEDSVFGGYVWIENDTLIRYYDTEFLHIIDHKEKTITRFPKEKPYGITGNVVGEAIKMYYLKSERLTKGVNDTTSVVTLTDDQINGDDVWKLRYEFADDEYVNDSWKNIWINKNNFTIPKMNYSANMQGENQYNQWDLSNIKFNEVSKEDLENRLKKFQENYTTTDYEEKKEDEIKPLDNGTEIPKFNGILYRDQSEVSLNEYKGKLTLYDFWYMDCFPCIKAIPHMNEMYNKYKDKGLNVVGVNPFDNNEKDMKRFPNFLDNNTIDYPIFLTDRESSKQCKIQAYPTFYLVDKNGKILYSEVGFNGEESSHKIDSLIQIHL